MCSARWGRRIRVSFLCSVGNKRYQNKALKDGEAPHQRKERTVRCTGPKSVAAVAGLLLH